MTYRAAREPVVMATATLIGDALTVDYVDVVDFETEVYRTSK